MAAKIGALVSLCGHLGCWRLIVRAIIPVGVRRATPNPRCCPAYIAGDPISLRRSVLGDACVPTGAAGLFGRQIRASQAGVLLQMLRAEVGPKRHFAATRQSVAIGLFADVGLDAENGAAPLTKCPADSDLFAIDAVTGLGRAPPRPVATSLQNQFDLAHTADCACKQGISSRERFARSV